MTDVQDSFESPFSYFDYLHRIVSLIIRLSKLNITYEHYFIILLSNIISKTEQNNIILVEARGNLYGCNKAYRLSNERAKLV